MQRQFDAYTAARRHRLTMISATTIIGISAVMLVVFNGNTAASRKAENMNHSAQNEHKYTNHLRNENSPYLLSHADNPVDWYPWGDEALRKARDEDKPIFLSIGYAACHWCHVMERESFEDEKIAAILNESFVSIKVDREQRPDLDNIYMAFTTALTGSGGWPMSVFLTPDLKPFFAGTYFPPEDRYGRPGFKRLITEIASAYREDKENIISSSESIMAQLSSRINAGAGQGLLTADLVSKGAEGLMQGFDHAYGGFGQAPKFPHALELSLFLRHYRQNGDLSFLQAALKALKGMANGGIYDHIGGGFARYSTDQKWLVPHFEKMLYDNSLLVPVYVEAYQVTGDSAHLETVRGTLDFVLQEMTDKSGGFNSSLDADSEHEEGKFYIWSKSEIDSLLGDEADLFCRYYSVTDEGNFEGRNILNITADSERLRQDSSPGDFDQRMAANRARLLEARSSRVRPATDDKILTSWNGLILYALCKGYQVTKDQRYLEAALKNAEFVQSELFRNSKLTHACREGRHSEGQFLEDYAYYLHGMLELYQTDHSEGNHRWLDFAADLADNAVDLFMDTAGTLYLTEADRPDLIMRPKDEMDGALPSPGSVLFGSLLKLNRLTGDNRHAAVAEKALRAISGLLTQQPQSMASALMALDFFLSDKVEIVIVGEGTNRRMMLDELNSRFMPNRLLAVSATGREGGPLFEGRAAIGDDVRAFVCRNSVCRLPVSTVGEFKEQLAALDR